MKIKIPKFWEKEEPPHNFLIKPYDSASTKGKPAVIKAKYTYYKKFKADQTILINMELLNGNHKTFLVLIKNDNSFKYAGGTYIIDNTLKVWNSSAKYYQLDYHQNCSLPISRKIPIEDIQQSIRSTPFKDVRYAINPQLLKTFIKSKVTEAVLRGAIDDTLKRIIILLVIITFATVIHLLIFMQKSGMFDSITGAIG